jgi:hypothetical protein
MQRDNENQTVSVEVNGGRAVELLERVAKILERQNTGNIERVYIEIESNDFLLNFNVKEDLDTFIVEEVDKISFEVGSDAHKVAVVFCSFEGEWKKTGEIKRIITSQTDVSEDRVSQILWDLSERGVLDKKPCKDNQRMKMYRINGLGVRSVEAA